MQYHRSQGMCTLGPSRAPQNGPALLSSRRQTLPSRLPWS